MFVDLDRPLNASRLLSVSAELLVYVANNCLCVVKLNLYVLIFQELNPEIHW